MVQQAGRTLELLPGLLGGHFEAEDDLARMHAHDEQVNGPLEKLAGKDEDKVGVVAVLGLLSLRGADEQLGRRVDDLDLADDGRRVRRDKEPAEVIYNQLVLACNGRACQRFVQLSLREPAVLRRRRLDDSNPSMLLDADLRSARGRKSEVVRTTEGSRTIRTKGRPDNLGQLANGLNVAQDSLLEARQVLRGIKERDALRSAHRRSGGGWR